MNNNYTPTREELLQHGKVIMDTDDMVNGHRLRFRYVVLNHVRFLMKETDDIVQWIISYEESDRIRHELYGKED